MNNDNLRNLYKTFEKEGYEMPSYEDFEKDMQDDNNLHDAWETLKGDGYEPPEYDTFKTDMGFGAAPEAQPAETVSVSGQGTPQVNYSQAVYDRYENQVPKRTGNNDAVVQSLDEIAAEMEREKPGSSKPGFFEGMSFEGMGKQLKEGGKNVIGKILGFFGDKQDKGSIGNMEAAAMPTEELMVQHGGSIGYQAGDSVGTLADTAGTGAVVGNVIQKNAQPAFYEEQQQRFDPTKPLVEQEFMSENRGFGDYMQQGIDRIRQGQQETDPTLDDEGNQLQVPLYNQEAALRGDIQRIDADVMRKFNEELAMNQQKAKDYMKDTPGNPFAPTEVNLMNIGREANKIADPSKAIESAIKYADEQTKDMPDEVRYQVIESLLGQMEEQLINERIPSGTAEYVFWRGFKDSDLGRIMSSVVDTNYEKYLDQVAASRYKAGFWENLGKGAVTLASDMWEYVLPAGAAGKAGKWAGGKISGRIMNDLIRRGVPKSQAARIAERLTANSVGKSILQHGASNAVTFGTAGAISGAVEGLTEPATVDGMSIERARMERDMHMPDPIFGVDQHDALDAKIKEAEAEQYSAKNLFGKIFERAAWGVGTGVATSFGAPLGEIIGHGRGVAGKILGDATRLGVNATAMTGVGALEQATTPGAQPLTFEDLLLSEANNLLTFGALEARGIYNRAKNYRNIQQFEKAYDITDADKKKMKDLGYGDMLDAVEQLTTGKTAGAQPAEKKPNVITRLVSGERVSEVKMPQTKEASGVDQVESQNLKNGLQQLVNDYNAGRISEEEARKWYGLITGDYSQQLQPITGVSQRTDISPEGKVQHFVDYLDAQGRRVRTVEAKTEEEAKQLSDDYRQEAQLNQISALEDMVTDKDVQEHFAETVRRDFGGSSGSETEGTETISTGGVREKIDRLNDLRARKKLHEMGEGKALTAEEERMLEEGLSTYERDVANIFGREDQLQEALQKQAEGGDLLPYEESLIQSAQNIYRNHAGHSKAASDFAREFEKRNGMEEGTLSQILEKKDRSEAEQKAVDDYVTDLQDYLRPRTEQVEIEEAGNPATNATESMVDMSPGVEPPTETPAGGAMQTEVASEAYSKGQAAVQANDAAAMRNIGYEMQKADARMSKLFTDDEAKAIYDAVESGDEDALAAVVQQHTEPAKRDAIEKLKEAHDAMRGVEDAINDSYIGNDEAIRAEMTPYQSEQGEIMYLDLSNGSSVYYVSGDLNNTYGTVMVAYTGEDGTVRHAQVPVKEITNIGMPMSIDDFVQFRAQHERSSNDERYKNILSGTELRKGNQVELTMGNTTGMFTVDGFFSNGDVQLRDENGGTIRMTKDEALEMMQATEDKRINQDLADEQAAYKEAERVRQEEEKARLEAQRKFEEERRGKIAEIQKTVVDEAAARPQPTEQSEEAAKWNGLAIADVADAEGVRKYLLDNYENEADADTFMNEQRRILRTHQRDDIQPEIDNISKQLDDYITGKTELSDEELTGLITQLSEWETEQNRLNGVAEALKDISDALPKTYAERNADVLKNASPYEQRMAELSKAKTNEDKVRIAKKLYGNDPDVGTLFDDLDVPADATELVSMFLKPRVLRWEGVDQGGVHLRGVEDELGKHMKRGVGRNVDSNNINTFLAAKGEGKTVDEFVHDIWESPENHPVGAEEKRFDDTEIRNALINLLLSAKNPTEIRDLIIDGRIAEAERILKEVQDREEEYEMQSWAESYHLPAEERENYEDYVIRNTEDFLLSDEDYQKLNTIFAEQNELRDEQNRRSQEMDRQPIVAGAGGEGSGGQAEVQRQGAEADVTEDQGRQVNGEGENLTDGTAVPGSDVSGGAQGEFERAIDDLGRIEDEWNDKILDYVSQHYPTQAVVSAQTNSSKGKAEHKAMLEDPVYQDLLRQQKEALDAADKKVTEAYKKEEEEKQANKPKTEESKKEDNDRGNQSSIQGIDGYDVDEVLNAIRGDIEMKLEDAGIDNVSIKGLALNGSRMRGDAREDSDLDVVVEYEGNISEDGLFNILNDNPTTIEGITVDINPITKGKSGTLEEYMKRSQKYDEEKKEKIVFKDRLAAAIEETNTKPTEGQKEAGNYKKGHLQFGGYNFTVENPKGSVRSGKDASGKPWSITMHNTYGYLTGKGHLGKDGDHLDVFINDDANLDNWNGNVFVVDQVNSDGSFDEHKIMYGFDNEVDALRNYLMNYSRPWHGMGNITGVDKATFDKWVESSNRKQKPFAETRFGDNRDVVEKVMDGIEKKKEVADLREPDQSDAVTDVSKPQTSNQNGRKSINAETQTSSSKGKDKENIDTLQEKGNKNAKKNENKIEDVGEVIAGARKDMRRKIAESIESATEKTLIDLPFSKAYKKPDLKKAVEEGALREEDATFYDAFFSTMVNPSKPKVVQSELRMKKWKPDYKTKVEKWAEATHEALQVLKEFVEATEEQRDEIIRKALENKYPMRDVELAEIEKRKEWNKDRDFKAGDKTTPNPLWVTYEVMKQLDYKPGEKLDIPYGLLKADAHGTGYYLYNAKNETNYNFHPQSVEDGISDIVWLAKLKRGDTDIQHPISSFSTPATKSETGETGRYRVIWGGYNIKTRDFDNKKDADEFAASRKQQSLVSPIKEVVRRFGYKVVFRNPLTNDKIVVDDQEFDTKDEAQAYLEDNYDELNEKLNTILSEQRKDKKRTELKADDLVYVSMVRGNDNKWTYGVIMDKKYANYYGMPRILKEGFATRAEAKDYADSIKDEVLSTYKNYKTKQKNIVYFDTGENSRLGEDYRGGKDVSAEDFMNTFGFRGVQFGNWTNQADRQMAVNQAYDAFLDLAKLIGVSPQALSLNGELGIAFGARGAGGFAAHYEPGEIVINLTKTQGAGSLAHEWWHALDNYFARAAGEKGGMVTDDSRLEMRPELRDAYNTLTKQVAASKYFARSKAKGDYWGRMHEVTARLLAEWVDQELKKRGELNTFLSRGVNTERTMENNYLFYEVMQKIAGKEVMPFEEFKKTDEAMSGSPYPSKAEVDSFADAMRNIFDVMEERVDEETGNVMLHESDAPYNEAQEAVVIDMPQVRLEKLKEEYQKLDDMMRDDQGRDFDEQEETLRANYIKNNGRKGLGEVVSKFLNDAIEKYGEKALTRRWDLQDEIADLESKMAKERSARRKNPKVVSHVEGNLFPEEKEGDLFDDKKAAAKPQPTKKPESKLEKLSDKQLLEGIGQNANSKDWDLYIDEYDKRHRDEYQDALAAYSDMLEKENVSLEDAYGMYADVAAKWNDKGFASDERSKLMAQVDALEEYVDRLESEAIEREEAEEEEAAAKQQPAEKKARYEEDKTDVRAHGYDLTKIRLRELGEGEVSHVERRYVENGTFSFTGGEHIESAADVAYIFRQLEDAAVENSFMVLIKDGVPTVIHLAIGSYNAVHAPIEQAFAAYKEIDPDNVIFLHNHPSGNLVASREDLALQRKVEAMFGRKALPGIIINTKSGKYAEFNSEGSNQIGLRPKSVDKDIPVRVFNFSKQVFAKDWNPETAFEGSDSRSMAAFVSSHRLGDHNKMSLIVMDQAGHITGNIFLPWTTTNEISKQANALQIATYVNQMGGRYALIYGNTTVTDSKDIKILKTNLDGYNVKLRDVMTIEGSAHDKGLLFEPDVEYKGGGKNLYQGLASEADTANDTGKKQKKQYPIEEGKGFTKNEFEKFRKDNLGKNIDKIEGAKLLHTLKNTAEDMPDVVEFTEENYNRLFGNGIDTPVGHVKMSDGQKQKLEDKSRQNQMALAKRTLEDPDLIINVPSKAKDGQKTERPFSYVFVKTFKDTDGKLATYFYSVSVKKDGLEVSMSNYIPGENQVKRDLKSGTLAYIKDVTLPSESSTSAQGDQHTKPAGVDSSEGKDTKNSDTLQEKSQKYDYGEYKGNAKEMMEAVGQRYHGKEMVFIDKTHGEEQILKDLGLYDEVSKLKGTPKYEAIMKDLRKNLKKAVASYNRDTKKIYIFAPKLTSTLAEEAYFHENIHAILDDWYGESNRSIADRFWDVMPDDGKVSKAYVKEKSTDESEYAEEAFAYWLSRSMQDGDVSDFLNYFDDADKKRINNILKTLDYDTEEESGRRVRLRRNQHVSEAQSGYSETHQGTGGEESEGSEGLDKELPTENPKFSIRHEAAPKKTGIGYKVFVLKDGKLYPPMVANPGGEDTPVGVWLNADAAPVSGTSKTGRPQVKAGGKGTQGGSGQLAYRPGWHLGDIPYALQFGRKDPVTGERTLFPNNFVWAEVEYANDVDYQEEAYREGVNANGKYIHALAGLKHLPVDGSYRYRTNPNPETDPWIITGAMKVNRILKPSEVDDMVRQAGRDPQPRQEGAVTDEQVEKINRKIAVQTEKTREAKELATKAVMQVLDNSGVSYHEVSQAEAMAVLRKTQALRDGRSFHVDTPVFVSNALKAVEGIRQEKATPEQWLAMIQKNGGLKAGEDKWLDLSDWLKEQASAKRSLTKNEVLDYIRENQIQVEETNYKEYFDVDDNPQMQKFRKEFDGLVEKYESEKNAVEQEANTFNDEMYQKYGGGWANDPERLSEEDRKRNDDMVERWNSMNDSDPHDLAFLEMVDNYGDDFEMAFEVNYGNGNLEPQMDMYDEEISDAAKLFLQFEDEPINSTRLSYTTEGLENKKEIALTVPTIDPYNESDNIHFGDAGGGRAVAWIRFGETTLPEDGGEKRRAAEAIEADNAKWYAAHQDFARYGIGDADGSLSKESEERNERQRKAFAEAYAVPQTRKVLVIDEIQSKRHQDGREKGYKSEFDPAEMQRAQKESFDYGTKLYKKYITEERKGEDFLKYATEEEKAHFNELNDNVSKLKKLLYSGIPDAPFEKNWHELALKRMLRYAAENGYDKVAWTKGDQQAERYNLGQRVKKIQPFEPDDYAKENGEYRNIQIDFKNGEEPVFINIDKEGNIMSSDMNELRGKKLSEVLGKNLADKILSEESGKEYSGEDLRIGGEGMKGFYDQILPRFMDKYGKKWGVKTGEVELPGLAPAGKYSSKTAKMWAVDVTPEMKESVMQGQPMFSVAGKEPMVTSEGVVYGYTDGKDIYLTDEGINPETPAHEYGHLWVKAIKKNRPDLWENIKDLMREDEVSQKIYQKLLGDDNYNQIHGDENELYEEVLTSMGGKKNRERFEQAAREVLDEAEGMDETMKIANVISKIRRAFRKLWDWIGKDLFGIKKFKSVDEVTDRMMYDFVEGTDVKTGVEDAIIKQPTEPRNVSFQAGKGKPRQKKGEGMASYFNRLREWERRKMAEEDESDPMPIMPDTEGIEDFEELKRIQDEYRKLYQEWEVRHGIADLENAELGLYDVATGKKDVDTQQPSEAEQLTDQEIDARVMQDIGDGVGFNTTPEGARKQVKYAVINRRKNLESASAEDAIFIHDLTKRLDDIAKNISSQGGEKVTGKMLREALPDIIEGTYGYDIVKADNGEWIRMDHRAAMPIQMTPSLQKVLDDIKDWYDEFYHVLEDAGLRGNAGYIAEGYVNHIWDKEKSDPKAWKEYVENYQRTKSPNMKKREIPTYAEGIAVGLVPKFTDITDIMSYYSRSNNEAVANRKFLDDLACINIDDLNKDGEVVRSLPLITNVEPYHLDKESYTKPYDVPGVGDVWVHKAAKQRFASVFGTMRTPDIPDWVHNLGKGWDVIGGTAKKIQLSFSGFHAGALTEVALAQMRPDKGMRALMEYVVLDSIKKGTLPAYAHPEDFKLAAKHLVNLGATADYAAADVNMITEKLRNFVRDLANEQNLAKKGIGKAMTPVAAMLDFMNKGMDTVLWNYIHDGFKIACFKMFAEQVEKRLNKIYGQNGLDAQNGLSKEEMREQLLDEAGQYVNDTFGGQYWELLSVTPAQLKWMRRALLSPDWLVSTQRHFLANFGIGSLYNEGGFLEYMRYNADNLKRAFGVDIPRNELRRFRSKNAKQCYILGVCVFFYSLMNAINAIVRKSDEDNERMKAEEIRKTDPNYRSPYELAYPDGMKWYDYTMYGNTIGQQTHLLLGRYKDGTEWYARWGKQFREFPELFMGRHGFEFPAPMIERMMGKSNPMISYIRDGLGTLDVHGFDIPYQEKETVEKYGKEIAFLSMTAKHFLPFSVPTQADKEFKTWDLVMPSQKGFTRWKAVDFFKTYINAGDMHGIERTYHAAVMNNLNAEECLQAAIASVKATQKKELVDGVTDLPSAFEAFDNAKTLKERQLMRKKIIQYMTGEDYRAFTMADAREKALSFWEGDKEQTITKDNDKYIMQATAEDIRDDYKMDALYKKSNERLKQLHEIEDAGKDTRRWENSFGEWIDIHDMLLDYRRDIKDMKKDLDGSNDKEVMDKIRKLRKEVMSRIDNMDKAE